MRLIGSRIGSFEILAPLGAGGMGEVYRARDARLKRDVALEALPAAVANDPDRLARFAREAEVLAALNHPHIAAIYGIEEAGDATALVLELVDGPTLAQRIASGPLPVREAVAIATQIAAAVEAAHDRGIIHRDLKPANIKLTADCAVKVLDFGLAKALDVDKAERPLSGSTVTYDGTAAGIVLGTAAYMSPEQARGQTLDTRTDVWAFGCVLYELLTGRPAFKGRTVTDVLAAVVTAEPDWIALPAETRKRSRAC